MKVYGGSRGAATFILLSTKVNDGNSRPCCFTPPPPPHSCKRPAAPNEHKAACFSGPVWKCWRNEKSCLFRESKNDLLVSQPTASSLHWLSYLFPPQLQQFRLNPYQQRSRNSDFCMTAFRCYFSTLLWLPRRRTGLQPAVQVTQYHVAPNSRFQESAPPIWPCLWL
jgi:hypothetical protein